MLKPINDILFRIQNRKHFAFEAKKGDQPVFSNFVSSFPEKSKILVVYGDNASGKSLITSLIEVVLKKENISVRNACVRNRTSSGIEKSFVYGDESDSSTGVVSYKVLSLCLRSCIADNKSSVAILDEPDLGLSSRFSHALSLCILDFEKQMNADNNIIITSHNKEFLQHLILNYEHEISYFGLNTDLTLQEYINQKDYATLEELKKLSDLGHENWLAINQAVKDNKQ